MIFAALIGVLAQPVQSPPILWYDKPATEYISGLPVGNGHLGAMVLGDLGSERIALNHNRLWRATHRNRPNPDGKAGLEEFRRLMFEGRIEEANRRAKELLHWQYEGVDNYQPAGDLFVNLQLDDPVSQYRRQLVEKTPALAAATRKSIERRLSHKGGHTGWSRSWLIGLYARLRDGHAAEEHLRHLITDFATISLLDLHPPRIFQIDGNFGGTAGITEMLLQSHDGVIRILPALPRAWPSGEVSGLVARGGVEVGIRWAEGRAVTASLLSRKGGTVILYAPIRQRPLSAAIRSRRLPMTVLAGGNVIKLICPAGVQVTLTFGPQPPKARQASISLTTSPCTSVRRMSRPLKR